MSKARSKASLPVKLCMACNRPFAWRKAWERDWEAVKFCSDRCRRTARRISRQAEGDPSALNATSEMNGGQP